jgi:hypothetical protein
MYDPAAVLDASDAHRVAVLAGFGLPMVLQNTAMTTAVVMKKRRGVISIPLPCRYLWFAHDLGAVARFGIWFHDYGHWLLKLFWLGLRSTLVIEVVFLWQAARVGRQEHFPGGTRSQWIALLLAIPDHRCACRRHAGRCHHRGVAGQPVEAPLKGS